MSEWLAPVVGPKVQLRRLEGDVVISAAPTINIHNPTPNNCFVACSVKMSIILRIN